MSEVKVGWTALRGRAHGPTRACLVAIGCLLRGLPLLLRPAPATPLRALCLVALDTLHVLRTSQPLSRARLDELATFLDFQAGMNALWDCKTVRAADCRAMKDRLEKAGLGWWADEYLTRLSEIEGHRPAIGGDRQRCHDVRLYREAVIRLALATVTAIALEADSLNEGIDATHHDGDVTTLFRLAMQCQIIDDILDYGVDLAAGLPSFLTASALPPQAVSATADAARSYARHGGHPVEGGVFPLRVALAIVTGLTMLALHVAWRRAPR